MLNVRELKPCYWRVLTFLSASSTSLTASPAPSLGFFSFFPLPFFAPPFFFAPIFLVSRRGTLSMGRLLVRSFCSLGVVSAPRAHISRWQPYNSRHATHTQLPSYPTSTGDQCLAGGCTVVQYLRHQCTVPCTSAKTTQPGTSSSAAAVQRTISEDDNNTCSIKHTNARKFSLDEFRRQHVSEIDRRT